MLANKLGVDVLLRLRFCKPFQSDNYVCYDLNNSALDFLIKFYGNRFSIPNLCWSLKYNFFMLYIKLIIKFLPKVAKMVCWGSKHDTVFCYLYTQD